MHHATIADLPAEIIGEILKHLPVAELIKKTSVCKLWNELITSGIKLKKLTVDNCVCISCESKWRSSSRPVYLAQEFCHENLFTLLLHRPILSNLRYCSLELTDQLQGFTPNDLNAFDRLIHLEIEYSAQKPIDGGVHWTLPNLETLKLSFFRDFMNFRFQVTIDCPKLKTLAGSFPKDNLLEIKSPQTITTLDLDFEQLDLTEFENVEVYRVSTQKLKEVDDVLLKQLPNLKTLDLYGFIDEFNFVDDEDVEIKPLLKRLIDYKRKAMRPDSSLFVAGILLNDERSVDDLDLQEIEYRSVRGSVHLSLSNEHLYMKNYPINLQDQLGIIRTVDYSCLMSLVREVPCDYFRRFFNLRGVIANGEIQNPNHFKSFLLNIEFLDSLNLINPSLQQTWYDQLPDWCAHLRYINLQEKEEIELNFDFFAGLDLKRYELNRELVLNSMKAIRILFENDRDDFQFKFRGKQSRIRKHKIPKSKRRPGEEWFDVLVDDERKLERVNSTEALNYFDDLGLFDLKNLSVK